MWRLKAIPDLTVPPGRSRKRFFAELLVFIFGIDILPSRTAPIKQDYRWQHYVALRCLLSLVFAADASPLHLQQPNIIAQEKQKRARTVPFFCLRLYFPLRQTY